ncbi:MAG TPA: CAP domain-containing protein [Solirubrobacteraceae bacterium]|nr:CAP domain-containing protein [Solirubrobacteraceae bacterium]
MRWLGALGLLLAVAGLSAVGLGLAGSSPALASAQRAGTASAPPAWLALINRYRSATGLKPVANNPAWDLGIKHHLRYLAKTPKKYFTGAYASAHTENPASPYYTADGAREAGYSDLALGGVSNDVQAIDVWLRAPFHAVGMLRAQLTQVALAVNSHTGYAGLDVIQGLNYGLPAATRPILFPGPGVTTNLLTYGGEEPSPLQTCRWSQSATYGLPLILLLPAAPAAHIHASVTGPQGTESTGNGKLCLVDEHTFRTTDKVYGPTGAAILHSDHAAFLIPRQALSKGRYSVSVRQSGRPGIDWSFSAGR